MLTTRSTGNKSDDEQSFSPPRNILPSGYNDVKGYHQMSYKRGNSYYCRKLLSSSLYIAAAALLSLCIWNLIQPMESDKITVKTGLRVEKSSPVKTGIESLPQTPIIDPKLVVVPESKLASDLTIHSPDAMGCYHSFPELDTSRHIVPPPAGPMKLVCCQSTKGTFNIAVHPSWAPYGAERFLKMVEVKFFSSQIAMFRALSNFLVQFGLAGDPTVQTDFEETAGGRGGLIDDPNWLPEGPSGREINGVLRFQKGYLAYAGAGKNSRGTQLIMSFQDNQYLAGGSPWEVPFGQLVGENSFETLGKLYTGYGEKVSQGKIRNRGLEYLKGEFPLLDYITSCDLIAEDIPWKYIPPTSP